MFKTLTKNTILASLFLLPLAANAVPTSTLKFAKGSYCSSFTGDLSRGRAFKAYLSENQELNIHSEGNAYVKSVRDTRGKLLKDISEDTDYRFKTHARGNYTINMRGDSYSKVEFCVY